MNRAIVHIDMNTFFVSCERLTNSELNGIPLIIGGGDRGVVASCSYEARRFGVRSAMPIHMAMKLCPQAKIMKGDMELYSRLSHEVTEIIQEKAPVVEKASIDEFYLDITGMDKFYGSYKWTDELAQRITKETGLPLTFALSVNKTVSKIGTGEGKQKQNLEIPQQLVQSFLNPLSIRKIPMVGEKTFQLLSRIGIRKIQTLSEMPAEALQRMIGQNGIELWKKANGIDNNPVEPYTERKSISTEHTFSQDTIDIPKLNRVLLGMVEKLSYQLRSEQWLTSTVTVKIRYANFDTETKQCRVQYTSADHILTQTVTELFDKLYQRRMRLRLIGVRFSGLVRGTYQIDLFNDTEEMLALYQAMDRMKNRYGFDAVMRCAGASFKPNNKNEILKRKSD
ncbi:DNA polymerase IV [Flavobacterium johnsoniae]|jgi:DNA polymerase-4|uniref:DNA polymerase IV n=1 Tax=Flavobacterium johnsoniae (strain ATCC 17061 / DSM 2064 / JCM 8514 / BCRC 14874 / CCUG 350202 / NBRC 14942 / NCIMB 11054 / UW101) TaxID=376686 RepID=A5FDE1_FLAJ1|nr:DNA polymerase IV [Flavobacterium johnsoniae]ABQ06779.1 DNA-directed DNA polymerase [Flavobacterium johnsoniae UW101]WQG81389.1 DNA polymerase IV [Flavobacterium johnsoniae UW101]SHL40831.1 DNA polymerase-4 [Flavobacterium johnsoniae]